MESNKTIVYSDDDFESYQYQDLGIIKIKNNVYEIVTDLPESSNFIQTLNTFEQNNSIQAIIIINEENCFGKTEYEEYINTVFSHQEDENSWTSLELSNRTTRTRQLVILNNVIKKLIHSQKVIISAQQGEVVTPFLGASLSCDIRLACENTVFHLSHLRMNLHPAGALPYFLPKYIGHAKASNILFTRESISVTEAKELGIIMSILPVKDFEHSVIDKTKLLLSKGSNAISSTKRLLNSNFSDLEIYLNLEESDFKQR